MVKVTAGCGEGVHADAGALKYPVHHLSSYRLNWFQVAVVDAVLFVDITMKLIR